MSTKIWARIPLRNPSRGYFLQRYSWRGMIFAHHWREVPKDLVPALSELKQTSGLPVLEFTTDEEEARPSKRSVENPIAEEKQLAAQKRHNLLTTLAMDPKGEATSEPVKPVYEAPVASEEVEPEKAPEVAEEKPKPKAKKKASKKVSKKETKKEDETPKSKRRRKLKSPPPVSSED